jgi:hypothetical protein
LKNNISKNNSALTHTHTPTKKPRLIADSGSFGHYLNPGDAKYLTRVEEDSSVTVTLPNDMQMTSSLSGDLLLNTIPM